MKTQFNTFYITNDGNTILCLHSHFVWKGDHKFYLYSWINKVIGKTLEDYIREDTIDVFFQDGCVPLDNFFVSLTH